MDTILGATHAAAAAIADTARAPADTDQAHWAAGWRDASLGRIADRNGPAPYWAGYAAALRAAGAAL